MDYTWLDFIIAGIFVFNILLGFGRGVIREIISIISLVLAFAVTIKFTMPIANFLNLSEGFKSAVSAVGMISDKLDVAGPLSLLAVAVSFLVLFVGTYTLGETMNAYVQTVSAFIFPMLALLDRGLGAILGFIRGYAFNVVLILMIGLTPIIETNAWRQSKLVPPLKPRADKLGNLVAPSGFPTWPGNTGT